MNIDIRSKAYQIGLTILLILLGYALNKMFSLSILLGYYTHKQARKLLKIRRANRIKVEELVTDEHDSGYRVEPRKRTVFKDVLLGPHQRIENHQLIQEDCPNPDSNQFVGERDGRWNTCSECKQLWFHDHYEDSIMLFWRKSSPSEHWAKEEISKSLAEYNELRNHPVNFDVK